MCGLQTSRNADEGSENHSGVYPPALCGFYSLYERQGGFFIFSDFKLLCMQKLFLKVIILKKIALLLTVIPLFICGCAETTPPQSRDIFAMDTYMNIKAYGDNADAALNTAEAEIYRLESLFSVTNENSDVFRLNNSNGKYAAVSNDVKKLLEFSVEMGRDTNGALDITIYPLLHEWGFTADEYKIPSKKQIDKLLEKVDYSSIDIDGNNITLPDGVEVDFGAVAKGYTSDRIVEILKENDVNSAIINLGGNIHALGKKPEGSMWNVAVTDPLSPDETLGIIRIADKAVVTSGNYERYFIGEDGRKYCHIIDPATGFPAENGFVSVTVTGESGAVCDALSTAFFVMGREKTVEFLKNQNSVSAILVEDNGNILISENIADHFENLSELSVEVLENES